MMLSHGQLRAGCHTLRRAVHHQGGPAAAKLLPTLRGFESFLALHDDLGEHGHLLSSPQKVGCNFFWTLSVDPTMIDAIRHQICYYYRMLPETDAMAKCSICGLRVSAGRKCEQCSVLYHEDCWEYSGKCAIFGCIASSASLPPSPQGVNPGFQEDFYDQRFRERILGYVILSPLIVSLIVAGASSDSLSRFSAALVASAIILYYNIIG